MIARIISSLTIMTLFLLYVFSDSPNRDIFLAAAIVTAISDAADRITNNG